MKLMWYVAALLFAVAGGLAIAAPLLSDRASPGAAGGQVLFGGMAIFMALKALRKARAEAFERSRRSRTVQSGSPGSTSGP